MNYKSIIYLLLTVCCLTSCKTKTDTINIEKGRVTISGIVKGQNQNGSVITLQSANFLLQEELLTQVLDSTGRFSFQLETLNFQNVFLDYNNQQFTLLVAPNDSLHLVLQKPTAENASYEIIAFSGTNPKPSEESYQFSKWKKFKNFVPECKGKNTSEYLQDIAAHMEKEDAALQQFSVKFHPTKAFRNWAKNHMIYSNANYLMDYKFHHFSNGTKFNGDLFDLNLFPVANQQAIQSSMFGYHLWHYATDKYIQNDTTVLKLIQQNKAEAAYPKVIENLTIKEKPGFCRDIMCFLLFNAWLKESKSAFDVVWANHQNAIQNKKLFNLLAQKKKEAETQDNFNISNLDPKTNSEKEITGDFFTELRKKHKGKVIYIDIWAAWCGPCRSEIPHSIQIQNQFKNKPVAFVNLCMSSEKSDWQKIVNEAHFSGDNYYFSKTQSQLYKERLKWKGFPTYMLIDKNGDIIERNAPRPSEKEALSKLLEKTIEG